MPEYWTRFIYEYVCACIFIYMIFYKNMTEKGASFCMYIWVGVYRRWPLWEGCVPQAIPHFHPAPLSFSHMDPTTDRILVLYKFVQLLFSWISFLTLPDHLLLSSLLLSARPVFFTSHTSLLPMSPSIPLLSPPSCSPLLSHSPSHSFSLQHLHVPSFDSLSWPGFLSPHAACLCVCVQMCVLVHVPACVLWQYVFVHVCVVKPEREDC